MRRAACCLTILLLAVISQGSEQISHFREDFWPAVEHGVPAILRSQDPQTGEFGSKPWIVTDQNVMWHLAVAWGTQHVGNPYYHDPKVLDAIMLGGDALIHAMDANAQWTFRKKDGSTWGQIYMPWTWSRWIRAYGIIKDAMPADRRATWEKAMTKGIKGMIADELPKGLQNIPATDAAAIYYAGQLFNRDDWKKAGADYLRRIVDAQDPGGFWTEHVGPVINYNFVYVDALALYYAKSKDPYVLPALQRAANYHAHFTYPDGRMVETVDERNGYDLNRGIGGVGFTFSAEGRGFIQQQWDLMKGDHQPMNGDGAASVVAYGEDGPEIPTPRSKTSDRFILGHNDAMTARQGPWFACLSAYTAPISLSRWIQDRQNFLSLYNDKVGTLVLGGGNTKLQPLWSTFTAGDTSLLKHKTGDEDPNFSEPAGLIHIPSKAVLDPDHLAVTLTYGDAACRASMEISDPHRATITYALQTESNLPVEAHATFLPDEHLKQGWSTATGKTGTLNQPFTLTSEEAGGWFQHNGWRVYIPDGATILWPAKMHNQYAKDGKSELFQARIVVKLPLGTHPSEKSITIETP